MFAAVLGIVLTSSLSAAQMTRWGWRIALLAGCTLLPFLFFMRRSLEETPEFLARRAPAGIGVDALALPQLARGLDRRDDVHHDHGQLLPRHHVHADVRQHSASPRADGHPVRDPLRGRLQLHGTAAVRSPLRPHRPPPDTDRLHRRGDPHRVPRRSGGWSARRRIPKLLAAELWLAFLYASYNGAMAVYLTEIMPPEIRTSGFSLAYSTATAIFGGFTPAICTYLIHVTGNRAMPGVWMSFAAVCGFSAVLLLRDAPVEDPAEV